MTQIPASLTPPRAVQQSRPRARVLADLKGIDLGLFDNHKTQKSVKAYKVVDVSEFCPQSEQCIIKYANVTRGKIAQICKRYEKGKDLGLNIHYHINEITERDLAADEAFSAVTKSAGCDPKVLSKIIYQHK